MKRHGAVEDPNEIKADSYKIAWEDGAGTLYSPKIKIRGRDFEIDSADADRLPRRIRQALKATREEAREARVKRKKKRTRKQNRKERESRKERRETRG